MVNFRNKLKYGRGEQQYVYILICQVHYII